MTERTISAPTALPLRRLRFKRPRLPAASVPRNPWVIVCVLVVVLAALFVVVTGMRPEYDAYGWLVWGKQAVHGKLNTNSAPSWKPLTFLFTFPYALLGRGQLWLWMVTSVAGAFAGAVFAGRLAYRLSGGTTRRRYARVIAALFAGLGIFGLEGYGHLVLIAAADPMVVALCLAAIDFHLSRRYRVTFVLLVLATLGRPEAGPLTLLYALWAWRTVPSLRVELVTGLVAIPLLWFGVPAFASHNWFSAGQVALDSTQGMPGDRLARVPHNFWSLYELPMQLAVVFALGLAIARRDRTWLMLTGAALLWLLTEAAYALHGWNASPRYMFEPAAVLIVLAAAAIGEVLAIAPHRVIGRWALIAAVTALVVTFVPQAGSRIWGMHGDITYGHSWARQLDHLHKVIAKVGAKRILACGQPVSYLGYQPVLAWELGRNVADIGWDPVTWSEQGNPIVLFEWYSNGWHLRAVHVNRPDCNRLATDTGAPGS